MKGGDRMDEQNSNNKKGLGNKAWAIIWIIVGILCIAVFPGKSTFWGWFPVSALKTFGVMALIVILNWFFSKEKLG